HEVTLLRSEVGPDITLITPGVRPAGADKGDQSRVATPEEAIEAGADLLAIGRPITRAADPGAAAASIAAAVRRAGVRGQVVFFASFRARDHQAASRCASALVKHDQTELRTSSCEGLPDGRSYRSAQAPSQPKAFSKHSPDILAGAQGARGDRSGHSGPVSG